MKSGREKTSRARVLFAMDWLDYELNLGIAQYAREAGWIVDDLIVHTGTPPPTDWDGDGAIAMLNDPAGGLVPFVARLGCPVVDLAAEATSVDVPRLLPDDVGIGATGAEHLLSCGLHDLAFVRFADSRRESDRLSGFRAAVERAGRRFHEVDATALGAATPGAPVDEDAVAAWLGERLRRLPRPLGVMCRHDREAMHVVNACDAAGLMIPDEVAVVGSDNDPLVCELGPVPLSSVDVRQRDQGYQAAKLLDALMKGRRPPSAPARVPAGPVIVRESSQVLAVPDPDLGRALRYIAYHYREPIDVEDVVANAGTTRRRLYLLFERHLGRAIHSEVLRRRIEHARRLLVTTDDKLYSVARASGFLDAQHLTRAFTREMGISPGRYREQQVAAGQALGPAAGASVARDRA